MKRFTYMTSILTFYIRGEIKIEQNIVSFKVPNTILGIIPLGYKCDSMAINQISSVSSSFKLNLKAFLVGLIVIILGLCLLKSELVSAIVLILLGFAAIINSMPTNFSVSTTSGKVINIKFVVFDANKANYASEEINDLISNRLNDTNVSKQADRIIENIK